MTMGAALRKCLVSAAIGLAFFSGCTQATPPPAEAPAPSPPITVPDPRPPEMPAFEWPPPRYSAFVKLPREWMATESATLGEVARRLEFAFDAAGYGERSYFWIPGGFALASRIEQIRADATPLDPPDRWAVRMDQPPRGFLDLVRALFDARPGFYRVIVFAVTDASLSAGKRAPTSAEASDWIYGGLLQLPASVGKLSYGTGHNTTALIYEFERRADDPEPRMRPGSATGQVHLERSGLRRALASR